MDDLENETAAAESVDHVVDCSIKKRRLFEDLIYASEDSVSSTPSRKDCVFPSSSRCKTASPVDGGYSLRSTRSTEDSEMNISDKDSDGSEPYSADSDDDSIYHPTSSRSSVSSISSRTETSLNVYEHVNQSNVAENISLLNATETASVSCIQTNSLVEVVVLSEKSLNDVVDDSTTDVSSAQPNPNDLRNDCSTKRNIKNQHACALCGKLLMRIRRHYKTVHKDAPNVVQIISMPDGLEKEQAWKTLRLEGTFRHNSSVLERGTGQFLIQRRSNNVNLNQYLSCLTCKGWFKSKSLHQHVRKCNPQHKKYSRVQSISTFGLPKNILQKKISGPGLKILMENIFPSMKTDEISKTIQSDYLICKWGAMYAGMRMQKKDKLYLRKVVSQNMRLLGRLLIILRNCYGAECDLAQFIRPEKFEAVTKAVSEASGDCNGNFKVPSLPITLGYILKSCAAILRSDGLKNLHENLVKSSDDFLNVYKHDWHKIFSCRALEQLREQKYKRCNVKLLPLADDIINLTRYLKTELNRCGESLKKQFSYQDWSTISKVLLVSLLVFNRKRVGDVQRIKVDSYRNRTTADEDSDLYNSLNNADKLISKGYAHLYTRGKKGRFVPVMIHLSLIPFLEVILQLRTKAGVLEDNPYLFAKGSTHFDGCEALRSLSKKSGAKQHQLLRSTSLRKHIATMSQVMNLNEADLDVLATYMGHSIDVHRRFYRIPDRALHLARISRLLMAVSSNELGTLKGKDLENLPMPDEDSTVEFLAPLEVDITEDKICSDLNINEEVKEPDSIQQTQNHYPTIVVNSKPQKTLANWTMEEKDAVLKHLAYCVQEKRAPQKAEVEKCIAAEVILQKRKWTNIKDFVRNYIVSKTRRETRK